MTQPEQQQYKALEAYLAWRTLAHQDDQEAIATDLALKLYPLWQIQSFTELDRTTPLWISSVLPVAKTAYLQSQRVSAVYAADVRAATLVGDPLPMQIPDVEIPASVPDVRFSTVGIPTEATPDQPLVTFDPFPQADVATSLAINGNYEIKAIMPAPEEEAMYSGLANSTGAAQRQALNGGRNTTGRVVKFDRRIIGYARVTDSNPCYFCALLASRGAVYAKDSFLKGGRKKFDGTLTKADSEFTANPNGAQNLPDEYLNVAKVHNHCKCSLRPVYSKSLDMDADALFYRKQWNTVYDKFRHLPPQKILAEFRDQYTPFDRPPASVGDALSDLQSRRNALTSSGFDPFSASVEWTDRQISALAA